MRKSNSFSLFLIILLFQTILAIGQSMPGVIFTHIGSGNARPSTSAIQSDGKIIAAGKSILNSNEVFTLVRYTTTGSLDSSFNGTGIVTTQVGTGNSTLSSIAVQSDGKIIAVGTQGTGTQQAVTLIRYNTNGSLDTTFGNNGIVVTSANTGRFNVANAVSIQSDNKIVICGGDYSGTSTGNFSMVARYNTNGSLDATFNSTGYLQLPNLSSSSAYSLTVQSDSKIIVGGLQYVARLNPTGSYDSTFNNGAGAQIISGVYFYSVLMQPDGKIVAAGDNGTFYAARFNANGSFDNTFNGNGRVSTALGGVASSASYSSTLQSDGKLILAGTRFESLNLLSLVRYNIDGSLDSTFNGTGILNQSISWGNGYSYSVKLQSDNKIVSIGSSFGLSGNNLVFTVARYNSNGSLDTTFNGVATNTKKPFDFDGDQKTDIGIYRPSLGEWWYLRSSDSSNRAFQFGASNDKPVPADFTGDGKTDVAIFRPSSGEWLVLRSEDSSFYGFPFGTNGDIPAPADYDGDGKSDAAVFRPTTGTWYISKSSGGTLIQSFGTNGDKPVVADYDGDGKADLAIYRVAVGEWWYLRSSDGANRAFQFGTSTDKPIQGDYTGDGKADVAIFRPITGEWFILRSEDSSFYGFPFGTNGDIPASGDYDGDGKFDSTIFRPSSATWYINGSTSGVQIVGFGANGDIPVASSFVP